MTQEAELIKVAPAPNGLPQTLPTKPERRLPSSDISISEAVVEDLPRIVEGLYASWPPQSWEKNEPLALRPPTEAIRHERFVRRLRPSFRYPRIRWIVAKHIPTGEIIGCAAWTAPGNPVHNFFRKTAVDFYGWRDQYNCSDEEFDEVWSGVNMENWDGGFARNDDVRKDLLGDEPHWYLVFLYTFPEWQGRGVGKLLLNWAIDQADATDPVTPMYLESAPSARGVYMHCGFVPQGEHNFLRRGPAIVRELKAEEGKEDAKAAPVNIEAVGAN
ncbi:acyl-CoA N-acyltransferase [Massarina eburnea CBS 473.64]|uniref:Acyl-CoA N-acyltransferase n=1 Tax=Massarina eburnea CBS 473.64 TaxID=1395130 RepID=A0A6A6RWB0_9PLEO|nr:acyl-CoA N-acyltransferase [Massarina eburnea CBS 473.64]